MPNVLLTEKCVRSCPYCFARTVMADADEGEGTLGWEDLVYIADWLMADKPRRISLLGGEPTLHRHFIDYVLYLVERKFRVTVFTSGIMSARRLEEAGESLAHLSHRQLCFVCNVNEPAEGDEKERGRVHDFLGRFGPLTSPGFNLYRTDFDLSFVLDLVERFDLRKHLRLGLAHPIPGETNLCIGIDEMKAMAARLASFAPRFDEMGMTLGFDCGMPLCIFDDAQLGALTRVHPKERMPSFRCGVAIDIGPDMTVWPCFPLARYDRRPIFEFDSPRAIREHYRTALDEIRQRIGGGIFEECKSCRYMQRGRCAGGCMSYVIPTDMLAPRPKAANG
jgi:radical SAM protein with 4Fe4S-binding SPASM domain